MDRSTAGTIFRFDSDLTRTPQGWAVNKTAYTADIQAVANLYMLPFDLLEAQVMVESSGLPDEFRFEYDFYRTYIQQNPHASAAAYGPLAACSFGLLQILLETAMENGFTDRPELLFIPRVGLNWGAKYLRSLLDWSGGDYPRALAAYNGGKAAARTGVPIPSAVQHYVDRVYAVRGPTA